MPSPTKTTVMMLVVMTALLAIAPAAHADRVLNGVSTYAFSSDAPFDKFTWFSTVQHQPAFAFTNIYQSTDACKNGNGGIRGLTFTECANLCLLIPFCNVTAFYTSWFGGSSACFAMQTNSTFNVPKSWPYASAVPVTAPTDQGSYVGIMGLNTTLFTPVDGSAVPVLCTKSSDCAKGKVCNYGPSLSKTNNTRATAGVCSDCIPLNSGGCENTASQCCQGSTPGGGGYGKTANCFYSYWCWDSNAGR